MIEQPSPKVYDELLSIWEEAVRSTHHFLTEADIQFYKPLIRHEYLAAVRLYIIREDSGTIAAFMGLSNDCIEMLFVRPNAHGHGYGSRLVEFAIRKKRIYKVDVNEQNAAALGFYLHMGFETTGRDALDATGKPFPILHLQIPPIRLRKATLEDIDQHDTKHHKNYGFYFYL
jgi:putative acetyltransferase